MKNEAIAAVLHNLKKDTFACFGDCTEKTWDTDTPTEKAKTVAAVEYLQANENADVRELHEIWRAQKQAEGWDYGVHKDVGRKLHPAMTEFGAIPHHQKVLAYLAKSIVNSLKDA